MNRKLMLIKNDLIGIRNRHLIISKYSEESNDMILKKKFALYIINYLERNIIRNI